MKLLTAIALTMLLTTTVSFAKKDVVNVRDTYYGIGFSQVNNGSGHGTGYTINAGVIKGRKSLEVGLIFSDQGSRISGGDFKYRIMIGNLYSLNNPNKIFTPYIQYNLMYQKGMSASSDIITLNNEQYEIETEPGMVATMGHYLSYGNKIRIIGDVYFDTSLGFGFYLGSLDKVNGPGTWGIHNENSGLTFSFKVGFGYTFN